MDFKLSKLVNLRGMYFKLFLTLLYTTVWLNKQTLFTAQYKHSFTNYKTNYLRQCIVLKILYTLKPSTHIKINFNMCRRF